MKGLFRLAALMSSLAAVPAAAGGLVDCPLRDKPFSSATPLIDILLSPPASAVVDRAIPGLATRVPSQFVGTKPPTFAAILTMREAAGFLRLPALDLAAIDRELAKIPVTSADNIARCARYDVDPPRLDVPAGRPRILLFEKINGFRDGPSVDAAHSAFVAMAKRKGWSLVATDKGSAFTPDILRQFDAVIWNNVSGDVLTLSQRQAFETYMRRGGGFVGVHGSAGDPVYFWDWYVDTLIGSRFAGHPRAKQFQTTTITIADREHPATRDMPGAWEANDEWYSFKSNPRASGSHVLATIDESAYDPTAMTPGDLRMGDHPIAWTRCVGSGRSFYSAIGHRPERYSDEPYVRLLEQAVAWAAGAEGKSCRMGR